MYCVISVEICVLVLCIPTEQCSRRSRPSAASVNYANALDVLLQSARAVAAGPAACVAAHGGFRPGGAAPQPHRRIGERQQPQGDDSGCSRLGVHWPSHAAVR
jgi:hypothetical protein